MADQQSTAETFAVTSERIEAPSWRVTVGWSSERGPAMGRSWVVQLPGSMTPDAVEAVAQTMRRVAGAAVESERRETTARIGAEVETLKGMLTKATNEREKAKDELQLVREECERWLFKFNVQKQIAEGATKQRDEQTARLADALRSANQYRDDYRRLVDERDALERIHEAVVAERDALKASKPTVDAERLAQLRRSGESFAKHHGEHAAYGGASREFHVLAETFCRCVVDDVLHCCGAESATSEKAGEATP